jgi:hypothetical protein
MRTASKLKVRLARALLKMTNRTLNAVIDKERLRPVTDSHRIACRRFVDDWALLSWIENYRVTPEECRVASDATMRTGRGWGSEMDRVVLGRMKG